MSSASPFGIKVPSSGPLPANILIIGEAPGKEEESAGKPFVGASGSELTKMLNEAGIMRTECRVTNVCKYRPPRNDINLWWPTKKKDILSSMVPLRDRFVDPRIMEGYLELITEIETCSPNIIIPLGNLSLWAVTGRTGILKWRSSLLEVDTEEMKRSVLPQYRKS